MKRIAAFIVAALVCGLTVGAALAAGDAAKGEALAKGCACHKSKGDLNGQAPDMLVSKMQAFKAGQGNNKAMISIMQKHSEADMADLAAYYAAQPKK